jgi:DNA-directed RNA polymerase subunit L
MLSSPVSSQQRSANMKITTQKAIAILPHISRLIGKGSRRMSATAYDILHTQTRRFKITITIYPEAVIPSKRSRSIISLYQEQYKRILQSFLTLEIWHHPTLKQVSTAKPETTSVCPLKECVETPVAPWRAVSQVHESLNLSCLPSFHHPHLTRNRFRIETRFVREKKEILRVY